MRCVGAEDPPCKRCRNSNLECIMEKPGRPTGDGFGEEYVLACYSRQLTYKVESGLSSHRSPASRTL